MASGVSNFDFGQLVAPTLTALANDPDVLVVVTTGGRSLDAIPGLVPHNARVAAYLPFEWLLSKVDVLVTNGGYGGVNQALSFGVPLVTAGLTDHPNPRASVGCSIGSSWRSPQSLADRPVIPWF
jgi:UDP:flavonoid glycosyltransferase YjiC (YdhE family)